MDIDTAKNVWKEQFSQPSNMPEQLTMKAIEDKMTRLDNEVRKRAIIGGTTFAILSIAMGIFLYFLYLTQVSGLAVLGIASWQVSLVITIGILFKMKRNVDQIDHNGPTNTVLKVHLSHVQTESQFYHTIVWWLLAPMSIGFVMILIGTKASLMISAFELTLFALCCFWAQRHNKRHVKEKLKPIEEELKTILASF
jgi:hypothetical protein